MSLNHVQRVLFSGADGTDAAAQSDVLHYQRTFDEIGNWQVWLGGTYTGGTFTANLYGRSDSGAPWADIATLTELDLNGNATAAAEVRLFPQMMVDVAALGEATGSAEFYSRLGG